MRRSGRILDHRLLPRLGPSLHPTPFGRARSNALARPQRSLEGSPRTPRKTAGLCRVGSRR
jgi:hypothetical protein